MSDDPQRDRRAFATTVLIVALLASAPGCSGWQVGHASLSRPEIHTVHVTMFRNDDIRRDLGEWMTEALCKEIEQNTNYTIAASGEADSYLEGRVRRLRKSVTIEDRFDQARGLDVALVVEVRWVDRLGQDLQPSFTVPMPASLLVLERHSELLPESGQSLVTAEMEVIEDVARQIRGQMEMPW